MAERAPTSVALRESERKAIEEQVKAYLESGGKIEQIPLPGTDSKPVGCVWRANYNGGFDHL